MIIFAKSLSIVLGLVVISKAYLDFKKKNDSIFMFVFWVITWMVVIIFSLFPFLINEINQLIGAEGSGVNTFIGTAFVFLLFVTYRVYTKANRLEKQIHEMVMEIGLRDVMEIENK